MKYVGLQQQITSNNRKSVVLLLLFPILVLVMVYIFTFITHYTSQIEVERSITLVNQQFISTIPIVLIIVGIWFTIAYFANSSIINKAAHSQTLSRKENMRVYNLAENICMSIGMKMPNLRIIETDALNAFASGINEKSYTVTLTRGIINTLEDNELEGVIAHELSHIRNNDVKLLIVSVIFVGIFSFVMQMAFRSFLYGSGRSRRNNKGGGGAMIILIMVLAAVAYFLSLIFRMALSRRREYMADAGAVELTRNPLALASALEKISGNSHIEQVKSGDLEQMYIDYSPPKKQGFSLSGLFASHPPIEKRIAYLKQLYNEI